MCHARWASLNLLRLFTHLVWNTNSNIFSTQWRNTMSLIIFNLAPTKRILKVTTCPSSSWKATFSYHICCTTFNNIQFRVIANKGEGLFSPEWISLLTIQPTFKQAPFPLTSFPLINLYQGKSTNKNAFQMA